MKHFARLAPATRDTQVVKQLRLMHLALGFLTGAYPMGYKKRIYLVGYIDKVYPMGYNYIMNYNIQTPEQLGQALRSRRKHLKLNQKDAAELVGLLPKTISNLENNPTTSSIESLYKLLSALNINIVLTPKDVTGPTDETEW